LDIFTQLNSNNSSKLLLDWATFYYRLNLFYFVKWTLEVGRMWRKGRKSFIAHKNKIFMSAYKIFIAQNISVEKLLKINNFTRRNRRAFDGLINELSMLINYFMSGT